MLPIGEPTRQPVIFKQQLVNFLSKYKLSSQEGAFVIRDSAVDFLETHNRELQRKVKQLTEENEDLKVKMMQQAHNLNKLSTSKPQRVFEVEENRHYKMLGFKLEDELIDEKKKSQELSDKILRLEKELNISCMRLTEATKSSNSEIAAASQLDNEKVAEDDNLTITIENKKFQKYKRKNPDGPISPSKRPFKRIKKEQQH